MHPSFSLADVVPHRPPMLLIDELVDFDPVEKAVAAAVVVRPEWTANYVAIEYMAQTAAALAGIFDRLAKADCPARPGFLLGTRRLSLALDGFVAGRRYFVTAKCEFSDEEAASFACSILDGDVEVARANLNAYRPADINAFMAAHRAGSEVSA